LLGGAWPLSGFRLIPSFFYHVSGFVFCFAFADIFLWLRSIVFYLAYSFAPPNFFRAFCLSCYCSQLSSCLFVCCWYCLCLFFRLTTWVFFFCFGKVPSLSFSPPRTPPPIPLDGRTFFSFLNSFTSFLFPPSSFYDVSHISLRFFSSFSLFFRYPTPPWEITHVFLWPELFPGSRNGAVFFFLSFSTCDGLVSPPPRRFIRRPFVWFVNPLHSLLFSCITFASFLPTLFFSFPFRCLSPPEFA